MNTSTNTNSRTRISWLATTLALLWSGSILAAPGEPIVNRLDTSETGVIPSASSLTLDVSWERTRGDSATSVQYRLDGKTLRAEALVASKRQRGESILDIDRAGHHDFVVALCNEDGCTESQPMSVTVAGEVNPDGEAVISHMDADAIAAREEAMIASSAVAYAALEDNWGPREYWGAGMEPTSPPAADHWVNSGGSLLGRLIVGPTMNRHLFKSNVDLAFALFVPPSPDPVTEALGDIKVQLTVIEAKIDAVLDQLLVMQQNAAWIAFDTQDGFVRLGVSKINNASNLIADWAANWEIYESLDALPTQEDFTYVKQLLFEGVGDMAVHLSSTSGAIKQLTDAVDMNVSVSDLEHYWSVVQDYVNYNKSVMARSLASLRFLADHDTSPSFMSYVNTSISTIDSAVRSMYGISGVPFPQVDGGEYIHAKNLDYAFALYIATDEVHKGDFFGSPTSSCGNQYRPCWLWQWTWAGGRPTFPGEIDQVEGGTLRGGFDGVYPEEEYSERYNPGNHGGINFRSYLEGIGMPTWHNNGQCYPDYYDTKSGYCSGYERWDLGNDGRWHRSWANNNPNDGVPHPYRKLLRGDLNQGGRLANFAPDRIDEVAFGISDFEIDENAGTTTLKMSERLDRTLVLVDAANGKELGSTSAADPGSIVIPASGNESRTINVLSQPVVADGVNSATFAESSFVIDSRYVVTINFEIEPK